MIGLFVSLILLTLAVSGRRPDAPFQIPPKPLTRGGHEHGVVRWFFPPNPERLFVCA